MNGIHDMGGMQDMGPIQREENEPVFHHPWEGRVAAMNRALGAWGKWNIDAGRYGIELLPPADYLRMSYYEKWLARNVDSLLKVPGNAGRTGNWQTRARDPQKADTVALLPSRRPADPGVPQAILCGRSSEARARFANRNSRCVPGI